MKKILASIVALTLLHQGHAAVYYADFSTGTNFDDPGAGVDGWVQSEPDNSPTSPKTWIAPVTANSYVGLAIGAYYDTPAGTSLTSTKTGLSIALVDPFNDTAQVSLAFGINDVSFDPLLPGFPYPERNSFSFSVLDTSSVSIASIVFVPASQTVPGTPGVDNAWNVFVNGSNVYSVFAGGGYTLTVDFLDANQFTVTTTNIANNSSLTSAAINKALGSGSTIGGLQLGLEQSPETAWGDATMGIANVAVVPEPSSALLVGVAALGLLRRRRVQA